MSFIEYYPGQSFMHKLDPRIKIFILLLLTIVIFTVTNYMVISAIFLTLVLLWAFSGLPLKNIKGYFKFLLGLFGFLIIVQGLFYPGQHYFIKPLFPNFIPLIGGLGQVTQEGVFLGCLISLRLITLVCLMPLITMTTPIHSLALGLVKMGMSYRIAYLTTTAINLIPTLENETQVIMDSQKMRGLTVFDKGKLMDKFKAYPALVVPLVIGAMRKAQMMGVAMDVRAFGTNPKRTYIEDLKFTKIDFLVLTLTLIFSIIAVLVNFKLQGVI